MSSNLFRSPSHPETNLVREETNNAVRSTATTASSSSSLDAYAHLAIFVRSAPTEQVLRTWQVAAMALLDRLGLDNNNHKQDADLPPQRQSTSSSQPVWLSTCGTGVAWLHFRLDSVPKYYSYMPYRNPRWASNINRDIAAAGITIEEETAAKKNEKGHRT